MIERFDNIGVAVRDFQMSAQWYEKLGFRIAEQYGDAGSFVAGSAVLYVFQTDSGTPPDPRDLDLVHNAPGIDHISFRVADVDEIHRVLVERDVTIEDPPTNQEWGSRTVTVLDPDGNRIYFLGPITS
jgi:catechol 2,3-dioxygenase-like lactoylglutathione lyase family enzyme